MHLDFRKFEIITNKSQTKHMEPLNQSFSQNNSIILLRPCSQKKRIPAVLITHLVPFNYHKLSYQDFNHRSGRQKIEPPSPPFRSYFPPCCVFVCEGENAEITSSGKIDGMEKPMSDVARAREYKYRRP